MGFAIFDAASGGPPDYASQAANQEQKRQNLIRQGTKSINQSFAGFTPQFYDKARQAYLDFALPQFATQYQDTKSQIGFGLANRGISTGSAAKKQWSDLARQTSVGQQAIADQATGVAQGLQKDVAASKNDLLNMLYQTADPAGAATQATSTAAGFQIPSTFAPIANQFSGLINQYYLGQILNNSRQPQGGVATSPGYGSYFAPLPATAGSYS